MTESAELRARTPRTGVARAHLDLSLSYHPRTARLRAYRPHVRWPETLGRAGRGLSSAKHLSALPLYTLALYTCSTFAPHAGFALRELLERIEVS